MPVKTTARFGSWESPLKSDAIASATLRLGWTRYDEKSLYWLEGRPAEGGRLVIVRRQPDGTICDAIPAGFNVRNLVHEYGGGAFTAHKGSIYFCNHPDQNVYRMQPGREQPEVLTAAQGVHRFADLVLDATRNRIICVKEDHSVIGDGKGKAQSSIVGIALDRPSLAASKLVSGANFYSNPRVSPDGSMLAWLSWNHPNMPWDGTFLEIASFTADGFLENHEIIAGGESESVLQPEWSQDGSLYFISDKSGWWNPFVLAAEDVQQICQNRSGAKPVPSQLVDMPRDLGSPQWVFGMSSYAPAGNNTLLCTYCENGLWRLAKLDVKSRRLQNIDLPFTEFSFVSVSGSKVAACAGSPTAQLAVVEIDTESSEHSVIKRSSELQPDARYISVAEPIEFPTSGGATAHAFFYKPKNDDFQALPGELPPLLMKCHGGPTGATSSVLNFGIQYWTSRGFAVVDVNYRGSSGYGRAYRDLLAGNWGVVDVQDCENAARYLSSKKMADSRRMAITGGSAGGYTVLCVLTFGDVFQAGASHYGVCDVESLCLDTHKFESRYGDKLIGPYPECKQIYFDRSPINFTDNLRCPVIFFQGLEDKVVLPAQAEAMVNALRAKKIPVAYLPYEGEQHGFRKAENIKRTLDSEFYFYAKIFGFEPADEIEPVEIENFEPTQAKAGRER